MFVCQSCPTLRPHGLGSMTPGPSVRGIFQARILKWVAISFLMALASMDFPYPWIWHGYTLLLPTWCKFLKGTLLCLNGFPPASPVRTRTVATQMTDTQWKEAPYSDSVSRSGPRVGGPGRCCAAQTEGARRPEDLAQGMLKCAAWEMVFSGASGDQSEPGSWFRGNIYSKHHPITQNCSVSQGYCIPVCVYLHSTKCTQVILTSFIDSFTKYLLDIYNIHDTVVFRPQRVVHDWVT